MPQPFLPRSVPLQQHSIMGQPYIELRHRAPENRLRLPLALAAANTPPPPPPAAGRSGPVVKVGEAPLGQSMALVSSCEHQDHLGLTGAEEMEEHLEGEDSAVKDLEDVEVKDLVDLNLNLDPDDGTEV